MGIGKQSAPLRQGIDIGRLHLWMAIQAAHPVIQIVDRDEENIWLSALAKGEARK